jgi:hypothetical protein
MMLHKTFSSKRQSLCHLLLVKYKDKRSPATLRVRLTYKFHNPRKPVERLEKRPSTAPHNSNASLRLTDNLRKLLA